MAEVLLLHHAIGQTAGFGEFAENLHRAGHKVHTPDLFEGGPAHVEHTGFDEFIELGTRAAEALPVDLVYVGFSLGVLPAQNLAQTRPGALGAVLCYSCVPVAEFCGWPDGLPVQIHGMDADLVKTPLA